MKIEKQNSCMKLVLGSDRDYLRRKKWFMKKEMRWVRCTLLLKEMLRLGSRIRIEGLFQHLTFTRTRIFLRTIFSVGRRASIGMLLVRKLRRLRLRRTFCLVCLIGSIRSGREFSVSRWFDIEKFSRSQ